MCINDCIYINIQASNNIYAYVCATNYQIYVCYVTAILHSDMPKKNQ